MQPNCANQSFDRDFMQRLEQMGFDVSAQAGAEFAASLREGEARWAKVVKATGFKAAN